MTAEKWVELVLCVIAGLATSIPLLVNLIKYIRASIREKNWGKMLRLVMSLMEDAEDRFEAGVDRKVWVLDALDNLSDTLDYDIDRESVGSMIDALCAMSKIVNGPEG